jgi:hypothetical protein
MIRSISDEVVITQNGEPVAKLARADSMKLRPCTAGSAKGSADPRIQLAIARWRFIAETDFSKSRKIYAVFHAFGRRLWISDVARAA